MFASDDTPGWPVSLKSSQKKRYLRSSSLDVLTREQTMNAGNNHIEDKVKIETTFRLSNNQTKLLFQERQVLQIAIPVPPEAESWDAKKVVWYTLPFDWESCTVAEYQDVLVIPPKAPGPGEQWTKGTQGVLGKIVSAEDSGHGSATMMSCVVATFHPPFLATRGEQPLKWPGKMFVDRAEINAKAPR